MKPNTLLAIVTTALATLACNLSLGSPIIRSGTLPPPATEAQVPPTVIIATQTPAPTGLLPAPLYYVNLTDQQIWRIQVDGVISERITNETSPVTAFDVSSLDGSLAYISNNNLILTDTNGANPRTLVTGGILDPNQPDGSIVKEVGYPHWSPDGKQLSYGFNGVNIIDIASGQIQVVKPSDPYPDLNAGRPPNLVTFYLEGLWSPDATHMIILYANYPEGGDYIIHSLADGSDSTISFPGGGLTCCNPAWTADSQSIYFSNDSVGLVPPGLWRVALDGTASALITPPADGQTFPLVSNARQLSDGQLYYFFSNAPLNPNAGGPDWPATHTLTRSAPNGVTDRTALRTDTVKLDEALWSPDGRGAVIVQHTDNASVFGQGPLFWADTANSPLVDLHATGSLVRWGK
jgi:hypothetical protein